MSGYKRKEISDGSSLRKGLRARHLAMISIGGVIGVGMFLGSGATVRLAGPGVVVSYALGGVIMMFVMMALAEMSVARPAAGSFREYASAYLHPYFGFLVGWIYWLSWVSTMAAEIVAATVYMTWWFPVGISWVFGLLFAVAMTVVNLRNVESFGEFEFWFSMIKVVAIVAFIFTGTAVILGIGTGSPIGAANYLGRGGFFPRGIVGLFLAMVMVMVAYGGTEVIGIAAAETQDPARDVPKAISGIIVRTLVLYVGSIAVLVGTIPWNRVGLGGSPFVLVYERIGIRSAADIMNFVVISAALSSMNSGLYTSSRMLYSLARSGLAPEFLGRVSPRTKSPAAAVLASTVSLYAGALIYYLSPARAFLIIESIPAFGFLLSWLVIALSHVGFRRSLSPSETARLKYRAPFRTSGSLFASAAMVAVMGALWFIPEQRIGLLVGIGLVAVISLAYFLIAARRAPRLSPEPVEGLQLAAFFGLEAKHAKAPGASALPSDDRDARNRK